MLLTIACACVTFVAAPIPKDVLETEKVVGTWKLVRSSKNPGGLTVTLELELTIKGKMVVRQSVPGGELYVFEGEYKVVKDKLPYKVAFPEGGTKEETLTIKKLTETELHVVDPDGIQEDFVRIKPEKKDPK